MTEYNEGDLLEAVKGERVVRDRVKKDSEGDLHIDGVGWLTNSWVPSETVGDLGYVLTVIEKAAPKNLLPTEPGYYVSATGGIWELDRRGNFNWLEGNRANPINANNYAPFTRLEAVAVTAKKVLDAIENHYGSMSRVDLIARVSSEFGVSS